MPTQQEIRDATDRFAALPHEEQVRIMKEQRERRNASQTGVMKLQQHGDLLQALVALDQDQARSYVFALGEAGVGMASEELVTEILAYIEAANLAKLNDLSQLAKVLSTDQVANAIKHNTEDFGALLLSQVLKD